MKKFTKKTSTKIIWTGILIFVVGVIIYAVTLLGLYGAVGVCFEGQEEDCSIEAESTVIDIASAITIVGLVIAVIGIAKYAITSSKAKKLKATTQHSTTDETQ